MFQEAKLLADVLPLFAKKLSIQIDINELHKNTIEQLSAVFHSNKGDSSVTFEIIEFDKTKVIPELIAIDDENFDSQNSEEIDIEIPVIEEEVQLVTKVSLPSRKLKINISKQLLIELEQMKIKFSLN